MQVIDNYRGMHTIAAIKPAPRVPLRAGTTPSKKHAAFDMASVLWRLRLLRGSLSYRFKPFLAASSIRHELRPFAEAINDLYFALVHYAAITTQVSAIVRAASYATPPGSPRTAHMNRIIAGELIKFAISPRNGLGFVPALDNSAAGAMIMYNLLHAAGFRPRLLARNAKSATQRIGVEMALNPAFPSRTSIIDFSLLAADRSMTPASLIDYYDNVVPFRGKPLALSSLANRLCRDVDFPSFRR